MFVCGEKQKTSNIIKTAILDHHPTLKINMEQTRVCDDHRHLYIFFFWKKITMLMTMRMMIQKWNRKNPSSVKSVVKIDDDDEKQIKINTELHNPPIWVKNTQPMKKIGHEIIMDQKKYLSIFDLKFFSMMKKLTMVVLFLSLFIYFEDFLFHQVGE